MNKITREHYPVSKLPDELRKEFAGVETVRLVVEEELPRLTGAEAIASLDALYQRHWAKIASGGPIDYGRHRDGTSVEDAVNRVREIRDGWNDE